MVERWVSVREDAMHVGLSMFATEYAIGPPSKDRGAVLPLLGRYAKLLVR
jgi:hypothetical protein